MSLLPFHRSILQKIHDPATNDLLVLARGLGLRKLVCTLLKLYDSPQNLVLLVNATAEEENAIGEELGIMGCRKPGLRIVGYQMHKKDRQNLYKQGGILSVTSQILVVDMLQSDISTQLITGMLVLHAEKVTPLVLEAFIIRLFREKNKNGFVKAFTDQPEHITSGMSPLKNIMKELQIRTVHIYPRFHQEIKESLERRRADVVELMQNLTEHMRDIHGAIIQCMNMTLAELKRSNTTLDLDDLTVENAYFRSFELIVRRQLDSVWHKVGPKTKQLVNDLGTLRRLLHYLLTYDPLQYHAYLETLIASNTVSTSGEKKQHQSPWMLTDAAHIIFTCAKRRCWRVDVSGLKEKEEREREKKEREKRAVVDLTIDEDAWAALDEVDEVAIVSGPSSSSNPVNSSKGKEKEKEKEARPSWLPEGLEPVLEELPKWNLLGEVLLEIEGEILRMEGPSTSAGMPKKNTSILSTNTTLIMTSSTRTCSLLTEYLGSADDRAPSGQRGRSLMMQKLKRYFWWKRFREAQEKSASGGVQAKPGPQGIWKTPMAKNPTTATTNAKTTAGTTAGASADPDDGISEALKKKDREKEAKAQSRRRVRGGAPPAAASGSRAASQAPGASEPSASDGQGKVRPPKEPKAEPKEYNLRQTSGTDDFAAFWDSPAGEAALLSQAGGTFDPSMATAFDGEIAMSMTLIEDLTTEDQGTVNDATLSMLDVDGDWSMNDFDDTYGIVAPEATVLIRAYSDDTDDRVLDEIKPKFIVMFEPDLDFVRRIEVYKSSNPGLAVRVYLMVYSNSCEEHKYLAGIRKEKEAFQRLIKERGSMLITLEEDRRDPRSNANDAIIKTISTRVAGGRRIISTEPSRVVVDMREFRSTLPSLLHASNLLVIPATLTVGDYILTPDICVERKSLPDLVQSFNSGRLYTQCELMCQHYKYPVLLIEFEEDKAFSLEIISDMKSLSYAKASSKYPQKKPGGAAQPEHSNFGPGALLQSKIVLLTLTFTRLRIIWSSSPYATAEIFNDLKLNNPEPDPAKAITIGSDGDPDAGQGVNTAAEEVLRCIPGITATNVKKVMKSVRTIRELCDLDLEGVQKILGSDAGKVCFEFLHKGERK